MDDFLVSDLDKMALGTQRHRLQLLNARLHQQKSDWS